MNDVEKKALKEVLHQVVDVEMTPVVASLIDGLPKPLSAISSLVWQALAPQLKALLDSKIDRI